MLANPAISASSSFLFILLHSILRTLTLPYLNLLYSRGTEPSRSGGPDRSIQGRDRPQGEGRAVARPRPSPFGLCAVLYEESREWKNDAAFDKIDSHSANDRVNLPALLVRIKYGRLFWVGEGIREVHLWFVQRGKVLVWNPHLTNKTYFVPQFTLCRFSTLNTAIRPK
ncbi:hypothetical protein MPTK1_5g10610 [Marchantia polymorpha subsp. ruderalis]|uniref:Uncharacterized protein n=2 Tax=Marchantia polymorpha TaxID=3197 RepID=A0AAF6BH04_MARPO|nr:hypothetical protein MARPO_0048s0011 [Marchantia polymorpha]BBN11288.1 hypothetical protein Mp_5g10610 [Marchantia polymorpha subsp. ruderalis]|eukprot:PTQ38883.1 hypothetical protein MARPO_0048s0011 [Marchantia polymorpha]